MEAVNLGKKRVNQGFNGRISVLPSRATCHMVVLCSFSPGSLVAVTNVGVSLKRQRLWGESLVLAFWFKPETEPG